MARINSIGSSIKLGLNGSNIFTKRRAVDNSELYIKSSLNRIYKQTIADCFVKEKLGNIRDFVDGNKKII